eukprot:TRINITY_DN6561_c0_g1_i1.p1 TRINITY_DN6561_c0_g1~~TRINITY_DN6561_c0_g1_i1.p1  ORF type:complete len:295 (+),score=37.31 TRINITY_DN6561_c0_g1_i1:59-943(+)
MAEEDERLSKSGPELFKELFRIYEVAEVDDYYKNGVWKDDLMKTDIQLIDRHRREAGAPEPPELSEVVLPPMPGQSSVAVGGGVGSVGGAVAELRLIALFVAKWKLDAARTKTALSKLLPARRRYVIANFKSTADDGTSTDELEEYIKTCESTNAWAAATAAPTITPVTPVTVGVKRPLGASTVVQPPTKLLRPATPTPIRPVQSPTAAALAARLAAAKAAARPATAIRPVSVIRPAAVIRPVTAPVRAPMVRPAWGGPTIRPQVRPAVRPVVPVRPAYGATIRPVAAYRPRPY